MALSNRILSGCWVCAVIGFSYFLCLKAQELITRAIATMGISFRLKKRMEYLYALDSNGCGVLRDPPHFLECGRGIHTVKHRRPRHDPFGPCIYNFPKVVLSHATVDLDTERQSPFLAPGPELPHLPQRVGNKLLSPEPGIHTHYQHIIHDVQHLVKHRYRRGRIDHDAR